MSETKRMGFYFDQSVCIGCRACQAACKDRNDLAVGILYRNVTTFEMGTFPAAKQYHYSRTCNHCSDPACVAVCPNQAMYVDEEDGTVQHDDEKCIGCQYCVKACPYGVPQYIEEMKLVHKCDACKPLREQGELPACVASCTMRALEFGPIEELRTAHPDAVSDLPILPDSSQTGPSVAILPVSAALQDDYRTMIV